MELPAVEALEIDLGRHQHDHAEDQGHEQAAHPVAGEGAGERVPSASMMAAPDTTKISGMRQRLRKRMPSRSQSMLSLLVRCQLQPDQAMPAW